MSKLSKLYQTMENLKGLGLSIHEDLIQEANELEDKIIAGREARTLRRPALINELSEL